MQDCIIYENCKQKNSEQCNECCWKYIQLKFQHAVSNIPLGYKYPIYMDTCNGSDVDVTSYRYLGDYMQNIYRNVNVNHEGLYLWGKIKGNGKTTWAIKMLYEYFKQLHPTIESFEQPKGIYINVPILFKKSRDNIDNTSDEFKKLEKTIVNADLVVFDDIGTEAPTKWVKENLYIYITEREMNNKPSIYTSNLSLDELEDEENGLGERIVDRIYKQVGKNIIELIGPSRRRDGVR